MSGRRFGEFELRATWLREDSGYLAEIEITSIDDGRTEWLVLPGQPPCESPAAALSLAEAALYRVRGFDARGRPLFFRLSLLANRMMHFARSCSLHGPLR
ncbi:Uncharacterised protein [Pseudomonas aeruginosa]|nr:Uncharacterised protein [Pseudomonas aeruginosa]